MATSPQFALDFPDHSKNSSFIDSVDSFSYLDNGLEYLQPFPPSPNFPIVPSPPLAFSSLNLPPTVGEYTYSSAPTRPYTPADGASISPPALGATYALSTGELSSDTVGSQNGRSGSHSPPVMSNLPYAATVPRSHRFNPVGVPSSVTRTSLRTAHKRKMNRGNDDSEDEDEEFNPSASNGASADSRREAIRKQRIESEQRRRDELRDGYARLKDTLPASNQKSSKVSLLDRATSHLRYLDTVRDQLENRLKAAESEVSRLRSVNEALMLNTARSHPSMGPGMQPSF